jgi:transaldolase/glucose-6-phosphate isomerase
MPRFETSLASSEAPVLAALADWRQSDKVRRLWNADTSLWSGEDEDRWLGWLELPAQGGALDGDLVARLLEHVQSESIEHVAVLGMGGSSLCPNVLARTFGEATDGPQLHVFDSTVPAAVRSGVSRIDLGRTLFVVASKSGSTIEPNMLFAHLFDEVQKKLGADRTGSRFVAITDRGSRLEQLARDREFAGIAYGVPEIGGRYSALSPFGMLPGALMGLDTSDFLARAQTMAEACGPDVPPADNPGVHLGLVMGALARAGRDKLTFVISPEIATLGAWLEQLIAESTGKHGKGIVAIGDEPVGTPEVYGDDRLFVYLRLASSASPDQDAKIDALEAAGHPVVRIEMDDPRDLGAELYRWEMATAAAGALLGVNPFTQPDVESAKVVAQKLMAAYEKEGALPARKPVLEEDGIQLFADPGAPGAASLRDTLAGHLGRLQAGDYFSINAYLDATDENEADLNAIRLAVRNRHRVATSRGYGPRFLHSTGQLHKGGPNTGVFLQLTSDDPDALPIPGQRYSFGTLAGAQAQGDFDVLVERGRRALWLHLSDPRAGLARLRELLTSSSE